MKKLARRYNSGKFKYELIPTSFLKELAKVFTVGAEKYTVFDSEGNMIESGADNWRNGQPWKDSLSSIIRHLEKFRDGEDFDYDWPKELLDKYGPTLHLANAAWGISTLIEFYKIHPELDNRKSWFKAPLKRVYLDIDGVIASFEQHFLQYLNLELTSPTDWNDFRFRDNFHYIIDDEDFWLTIPKLIEPIEITYPISGYVTSRPISNEITNKWLKNNGFPKGTLINVGLDGKKSEVLKDICDIFIDDSIENFIDCQSTGITCYLMSRPHNIKFDVGHFRIETFKEFMQKL